MLKKNARAAWATILLAGSIGMSGIARAADRPEGVKASQIYTVTVDDIDVALSVPLAVKELRGVVVKPADKSVSDRQNIWTAAIESWGFAEMGMMLKDVNKSGGRETKLARAIPKALKLLAEQSGHKELENLPFVALGMSKGGGWSSAACREQPERAIAYASVCGWMGGDPSKQKPEYLAVPGLFVIGSVPDGFHMLESIDKDYVPAMKQGDVRWTCALSWGAGHAWLPATTPYVITYLDQAVKLRLPAEASALTGLPKLRDLPWNDGWAGDRSTWDSASPQICPLSQFKGDRASLVWQPNRYLAYVWRAFMVKSPEITFGQVNAASPLVVENDRHTYLVESDTELTVAANVTAKAVKVVRFYDGDIAIGEAAAAPYSLSWKKVPAGNHAVIAVAELEGGDTRSSNILWVAGAARQGK